MFNICNQIYNIKIDINIVTNPFTFQDKINKLQICPNNQPRIKKLNILQKWKENCIFKFSQKLFLHQLSSSENQTTIHHKRAKQVERDAQIQIRKAERYDVSSQEPEKILSNSDFQNKKYNNQNIINNKIIII
jgi:hypothetical protein